MGRFEKICESFVDHDKTVRSNNLMKKLRKKLEAAGITVMSFTPRTDDRLNEPELELRNGRSITLDLGQGYHPYTLWKRDSTGGRFGEGFPQPNRPNVPHEEIQDQIIKTLKGE